MPDEATGLFVSVSEQWHTLLAWIQADDGISNAERFGSKKTTSGTTSPVSGSCPALPHVARVVIALRKSRKSLNKKPPEGFPGVSNWVQGLDLNQRPSGYEPDELPGCSTLQQSEGATCAPQFSLSTPISKISEFTLASASRDLCFEPLR